MIRQRNFKFPAAVHGHRRKNNYSRFRRGFPGIRPMVCPRTRGRFFLLGGSSSDSAVFINLQIRLEQAVNIGEDETAMVSAIEEFEDIRNGISGQGENAFIHREQLDGSGLRPSVR